jgi:F-type H+-transporting ATPase subunit b
MSIVEYCASSLPFIAAAAGGGVTLDFDKTVLLQMALFATLIVVLKPLLFEPLLSIFEERERRSDGAKAEARRMQEQAGALLRKYESELDRIQRVAAEEREQLRQETSKLEAAILKDARETTTRILEDGQRRIRTEVEAIQFELGQQAEILAQLAATRVLGREVN